jgi:hypothetical protein
MRANKFANFVLIASLLFFGMILAYAFYGITYYDLNKHDFFLAVISFVGIVICSFAFKLRPNYKINLVLTGLSVVFVVFFAEVLFRFYLFGWDSFSIEKVNSVHSMGVSGLIQPSPYPKIAYERKPNLSGYFKMARFETNSQGLRDKEYSIVIPNNTFRVAVIGDSLSVPSGVNLEMAYHTLLEEKFNQEQKDISFEFINFSVGGYYFRQYLEVIQYKALKYDPQLILIGFSPYRTHLVPPDKWFQKQYQPKRKTYPFFESFLVTQALSLVKLKRNKFFKKMNKENFSEDQLQYMKRIFSKIGTISKEKNIPVVVAYLSNENPAPRTQLVKRIVTEKGLHFIDATTSFHGTNISDYRIYAIDSHPNGKANKIFAETIYNYLKDMGFPDSYHYDDS